MRTVAAWAQVSHQTVSRVLNDHPHVSAPARRRVEEAIDALGYRLNPAARSLVTRRSRTMGVLVMELAEYGPSQILLGFERAAREEGFFVSIASVQGVSSTEMRAALEHLEGQAVEGIAVIVSREGASRAIKNLDTSVPVVWAGAHSADAPDAGTVDQRSGARKAVDHLLDLGHRRIGHVSGPLDWYDATERLEGWKDALESAGLAADLLFSGDWTAEHGYLSGLRIAGSSILTAVFAASDQIALGLLRGLQEGGLRVPDDVSVVGYDDQPAAAYFSPPLTSVRVDFEHEGRRCWDVLASRIQGGDAARIPTMFPELVVRRSTRCCGEV
ncbi:MULTISPECIES: substrate-binding domain-containing protein [unclassified Arthrobacter]|uniref:LacI family DNA-binding transcriptional regulator n=1 Tax=unclassified Arthrobacter TaxID=235627 RepID=UPI002883415C|nr:MULTISPECIES: substrate-binding domain-containing protein [unclassified Arthrobacter]